MQKYLHLSNSTRVGILMGALTIAPNANAAALSLQDAVRSATTNSPEIQAAEAARTTSEWRKTEAFAGYLPQLGLTGNYLLTKKYVEMTFTPPGSPRPSTIPQILPTTNWVASAQVPIFDGNATKSRVAAASNMLDSATQTVAWQKFKLSRDVTLQYYKAIAAQALREVAKQNELTLIDHLKDVQLSRKVGLATHYDVLRVEVQASDAKAEVLNTEDNMAMARIRLGELMGLDLGQTDLSQIEPSGALPLLDADSIKAQKSPNQQDRADLLAMQKRVDGLIATSEAARKHYYPKFSLFGQYQYYNNQSDSFTKTADFRAASMTGISMNWTLFDGFSSTAREHTTASERVENEANLTMKRHRAKADAEFWRRKFQYFTSILAARRSDVTKSEESLRLAKVGQKEGARTTTDLLDAEAELFRAKANAINAQIGSIEALLNLELATGQTFHDFH
ncbi:MAG: TolC family protein [Proteobacteria bacterium]|nr:TolC family protein [Pseudomonadota bacterium]